MLSGDAHKVWIASCEICSLSQNHEKIMKFMPYVRKMRRATKNIELGGLFAPGSRFLKQVFRIFDFHKKMKECPCGLLGEDSNPKHLVEDGYFQLLQDTVSTSHAFGEGHYIVRCKRCQQLYNVEAREYHYTWWDWQAIEGSEGSRPD